MCGRYRIDDGRDSVELREIIDAVNWRGAAAPIKTSGEIFPTDTVPVVASSRRMTPAAFAMWWGYALPEGGRRIINARSETAESKPLFRDGMRQRRCAVPATNYYEWARTGGRRGAKYAIRPPEGDVFYMAGIYRIARDGPEFAILTREAGGDIAFIHSRMPVILPRELMEDWIDPRIDASELLMHAVTDVTFECASAGEQLSMPL